MRTKTAVIAAATAISMTAALNAGTASAAPAIVVRNVLHVQIANRTVIEPGTLTMYVSAPYGYCVMNEQALVSTGPYASRHVTRLTNLARTPAENHVLQVPIYRGDPAGAWQVTAVWGFRCGHPGTEYLTTAVLPGFLVLNPNR